jgi:hypothetical protein
MLFSIRKILLRIITKAHLDGVGRGEWGEAHILAHKAGYVRVESVKNWSAAPLLNN